MGVHFKSNDVSLNKQLNKQQLNKDNNKKANVSFASSSILSTAGTYALRFLDTNEAWGANTIDVCSMVIPRTVIDTKRNPFAGIETLCREMAGVVVHSIVGLFGMGAAVLLNNKLKNNYDVDFKHILADSNSVDHLAKAWHKSLNMENALDNNGNPTAKAFINYVDNSLKGLKGLKDNNWVEISDSTRKNIVDTLGTLLGTRSDKNIPKLEKQKLINTIISEFGTEKDLKFSSGAKVAANDLFEDLYSLGNTFKSKKVTQEFLKPLENNAFLKQLKKLTKQKTVLGLAGICAIAASVQKVNRAMTKKRTGSDGFVGYSDFSKDQKQGADKSLKFKLMKLGAAAVMVGIAHKAIGAKSITDFWNKVQFKGKMPTLDQLKVVYATTIVGRCFAASDKNELRETATRDYLGYTNWLVLGGLAGKTAANILDKSLINYDKAECGNSAIKKILKGSLRSHDEIVDSVLGSKALDAAGNRLGFKKYFEQLDKTTITKLRKLNTAQLIGYVYTGLILGVGIPMLNKYLTERSRAKQQTKTAETPVNTNNTTPPGATFQNSKVMPDKTKELFKEFIK